MSRRFTASILLEQPWPLNIDAIAAAVARRFPQVGRTEAVVGQSDVRDSALLRIDGGNIVITSEDVRCAPADEVPRMKMVRRWDGSRDLARHTAHVTVSCGGRLSDLAGVKAYAAAVHFVTAAILDLTPALGVYWHGSHVLNRPQAFSAASGALLQGEMPLDNWVGFASYVPSGYAAGDAIGMVSHGLRPFLGRELELAPRRSNAASAHLWISSVAQRVLGSGLDLGDGLHVIDAAQNFDLTVRERTFWLRRDLSSYVLVSPDAVVEVASLRPRHRRAA
ncbi:MAG: hypothetical protein AAF674_05890 [Pseudomonadota bacterium]